jgi:hypothetical protein
MARRLAISDDYEVYISEEIQMEGDPTSFEEAWEVLIHPNGLRLWKMKWNLWAPIEFRT